MTERAAEYTCDNCFTRYIALSVHEATFCHCGAVLCPSCKAARSCRECRIEAAEAAREMREVAREGRDQD